MKGRAHHLLYHVESGQCSGVYHEKAVSLCNKSYFPFFRRSFTYHSIAGKGLTEDQGGFVFMDFVLFKVQDIEMILSKSLEVTDIPIAYGVIFPKGRTFEFTGSYLRHIVGELGPHSILDFDFFDQYRSPLS
jgi:hypothetical protein